MSPQSYGFYVTYAAWFLSAFARVGFALGVFLDFKSKQNLEISHVYLCAAISCIIVLSIMQLVWLFKFNSEYNDLDGLGCEGNENYEGMGSRVTWMSVLCLLTSNSARCYSI